MRLMLVAAPLLLVLPLAAQGAVWVVDDDGGPGGDGGNGMTVAGSATTPSPTVHELDLTLAAGPGGASFCFPGLPGTLVDLQAGSFVNLAGNARSFRKSSPIRTGAVSSLTYTGGPGELVFAVFGTAQAPTLLTSFSGTLVPRFPLPVFLMGSVPASGVLNVGIPVSIGAPIESIVLYEQAAFFSPLGGALLSEPRVGVLLGPGI